MTSKLFLYNLKKLISTHAPKYIVQFAHVFIVTNVSEMLTVTNPVRCVFLTLILIS